MAALTAAPGAGDRPAHPSISGAGADPSSTDTPFSGWAGLTPQPENIPEALKALDQWVCWRAEFKYGPDGKLDRVEKIPVNPFTGHNASSTDPATWAPYEVALAAYDEGGCDGLGFVLTPSDCYLALDFDHVGDAETGELREAVARAIGALDTYAEWSPSGTGVRIFGRGAIPPGRKNGAALQFWERARFLTVTGHKINGAELGDFNAETLAKVIDHFNPPKSSRPDAPRQGNVFDIAGAIREVLVGDSLHDSLRDLAASMAAARIAPHVVTGILRGLMDHSMAQAKTPGRWEERAREIDGLVESAMKFAKASDGPPREWPDIEPLGAGFTEPLPFPVGSLPDIMQKAVVAFHAYGQQPIPLIVCSSLSAMSVACQGHANVARDAWLVGPISVFCLPMGESGERKTAVDNAFSRALREWEREQQDAAVEEIKRAKGRHRGWEAKMKGLERALGELTAGKMPQQFKRDKVAVTHADIEDRLKLVEQDLENLARDEPVIPTKPRLLYSDTTIEGLLQSMERGLPIGSLWEDEAGVTFGSVGLSNERLLSFLTGMSKLWDGKSPSQTRASVESRDARGKRVCANLMIQPFLLAKLAALMGGTARNTGFLSRFLICEPQSTMGVREYRAPSNLEQVNDFNRRVRELLDMPIPMVEGIQLHTSHNP